MGLICFMVVWKPWNEYFAREISGIDNKRRRSVNIKVTGKLLENDFYGTEAYLKNLFEERPKN